jgi:hypothetical protein
MRRQDHGQKNDKAGGQPGETNVQLSRSLGHRPPFEAREPCFRRSRHPAIRMTVARLLRMDAAVVSLFVT